MFIVPHKIVKPVLFYQEIVVVLVNVQSVQLKMLKPF